MLRDKFNTSLFGLKFFFYIIFVAILAAILDVAMLKFITDTINYSFTNYDFGYLKSAHIAFASSKSFEEVIFFVGFSVIIFSFILRFVVTKLRIRFVWNTQLDLSKRLINSFFKFPFDFANNNKSIFNRSLIVDSVSYTTGYLDALIRLIVDAILIFLILLYLFFSISFISILGFLSLFFCYGAIIFFIQRKVSSIGEDKIAFDGKRIDFVNRLLDGLRWYFITKNLEKVNNVSAPILMGYSEACASQSTIKQVPRVFIEYSAYFLIFFTLTLTYITSYIPRSDLPLLVLSFMKITPSMLAMYSAINIVKFNSPAAKQLEGFVKINTQTDSYNRLDDSVKHIILTDLTYSHNTSNSISLFNINHTFKKNCHTVITGPSGSGKSTLIGLISGLFHPSSGSIQIFTSSGNTIPITSLKIAYVSQDVTPIGATVFDELFCFANQSSHQLLVKATEFMEAMNLTDIALDDLCSNLSTGQLQRLSIIRALITDADLLILDEITSALDDRNSRVISSLINAIKKDVIVISVAHRAEYISAADTVLCL